MYNQDRKRKYHVQQSGLADIVKSLDVHYGKTNKKQLLKEGKDEWYTQYMSGALDEMEETVAMVRGVLTGLESATTSLFQECRYIYVQNGLGDKYKIDKLKTQVDFTPIMSKGMEQFVFDFSVKISFELPNIIPDEPSDKESTGYRDAQSKIIDTNEAIDDAIAGFKASVDMLNWYVKTVKTNKSFKGNTTVINIDVII